jgi:Flp pilus assembly protein TadB
MSEAIRIPTYLLPIGAAVVSFLMGYAAMSANVSHADEARERIEAVAEEAIKKSQQNGQAIAVTDQKVQAVIESLSRQEKIQEKTNEQIQALVQALLAK